MAWATSASTASAGQGPNDDHHPGVIVRNTKKMTGSLE
jgi:hypothetical protein